MANYSDALESKLSALRLSISARDDGYEDREHRRRFGKYERLALQRADPYFWSRQILDAVLQSSKTLPQDTRLSLSCYRNWQAGWFWFERPVDCGGVDPFNGLLWCVTDVNDIVENRPARSMVITTYGRGPGGLPQAVDTAYIRDMASLDELAEADRKYSPEVVALARSEHLGDQILRPSRCAGLFSFLLTSLLWIEQTILVTKEENPNRSLRRRLERDGIKHDPIVKVVTLRRQIGCSSSSAVTDGQVEWSCQWIVRGHWRQQFYPSTGERKPLFILPYVKGPDDKPLKPPPPAVFAVTR